MYHVAGESLLIEARDDRAAGAIDGHFAGWYLTRAHEADVMLALTPVSTSAPAPAPTPTGAPAIVVTSDVTPAPAIPDDWPRFDVAGGGTCYTDGRASYLDLDGSIVAIGAPDHAGVEVWMDGLLPLDAPVLTRVVTYALSAALRQRRRFELHSGAVVDPANGRGVLIVGPSGSGKSTLTVHLAAAGWPFLTDDVLLLSKADAEVIAWPLRRCFAITPATFAASRFLQARASLDDTPDKQPFLPHDVFAAPFEDRCVPGTLVFAAITGERHSRAERLSRGEAMARLIRMSPWSCYDRSSAAAHLAVLSALATQATAYALFAGRDLLDADVAVRAMAACTRAS
jgi:hypothetical protein